MLTARFDTSLGTFHLSLHLSAEAAETTVLLGQSGAGQATASPPRPRAASRRTGAARCYAASPAAPAEAPAPRRAAGGARCADAPRSAAGAAQHPVAAEYHDSHGDAPVPRGAGLRASHSRPGGREHAPAGQSARSPRTSSFLLYRRTGGNELLSWTPGTARVADHLHHPGA